MILNYILPIISYIDKIYHSQKNELYYLFDNLYKGYNSDLIVFFEDNPIPYIYSYITKNHGIIVWKYSRLHNIFFNYNCLYKDYKKFPIISASIEEVKNDNTKVEVACLDDFFYSLKIEKSNIGYPKLQQVLEVWSYNNGIIFDRQKTYLMKYLDDNLEEHTKNIFKDNFS
jgi:hypothetical protein